MNASTLLSRVPASALNAPFAAALWPSANAFDRALEDPRAAQQAALARVVESLGGARHHKALRGVRRLEDLQRAAPVTRYEDLADAIARAEAGEPRVLSTSPLVRFERSGGSSGAHKLVPFTQAFLAEMNHALGPWLFDLVARHAGVARGCAYWSISPMGDRPRTTSGGIPIGADDDASYFPRPVRALLSRVLAAPAQLAHITDVDECRYATLRVLLERDDLALISVWSPTFLSLLLDALHTHRERLARDLADGACSISAAAMRMLPWRKLPERAQLLERTLSVRALWPSLALVSMWTDGASAAFAADVERRLEGVPVQPKGLLATEGVVSVPYRGARPLAVSSHVLEFVDEDAPDAPPLFAHEVERGKNYQVLLTTSAGLVRYRLGDRVCVTGALEATPTIRFLGRAGVVSDLVGEKLAIELVAQAIAACVPRARFAMLAPARDARGYLLFVESADSGAPGGERGDAAELTALARALDAALCASHPYDYARKLGQLAPVRAIAVHDGARRFEAACIARGQRAGEIKATPLHLARDWEDALGPQAGTHA